MTLRERLADWISGGEISQWRMVWIREREYRNTQTAWAMDLEAALQAIADATRNGKSGTARKVHRMATEALK